MNQRSHFAWLAASTSLAAALVTTASSANAEDTLFAWAGDADHVSPDFIAVIDFDKGAPTYGDIIDILPLPNTLPTAIPLSTGAIGNEPHHVGISADKQVLAAGGLLSILRVQNQNFFWDISNPRAPVFLKANTLPVTASIADEFVPKQAGGFFTTFMGGAGGLAPGRVVEYDNSYNEVGQWPLVPPLDGFNPHGIAIDEAHNLLLTSDFVCPLHTLNVVPGVVNGKITARGAVRVWNLGNRTITKTIKVGSPSKPAGTINVELIPNDPQLRAYVTGVFDGKLYLVNTQAGNAVPALDLNQFALPGAAEPWPHLFKINNAGTRLVLTLNYKGLHGKVLWINIEDREHPTILNVVDLGQNSGPHYVNFSPMQDRVVVSDYFLVQDLFPSGVVRVDGDHKIHALNITNDTLVRDPSFDVDFNRDIPTGPARPHGVITVNR